MGTISLEAAIEAAGQANQDLLHALDALSANTRMGERLALGNCLQALNYTLAYGMTPEARKKCESARRMVRAALGLEGDT